MLVGDNPASHVYVRNKHKACADAGLASWVHNLPADTSQPQLLDLVDKLNADPQVHGILVQLPLPKQIDEAVIRRHFPAKDVDCFHPGEPRPAGRRASALLSVHAARRLPIARSQRNRNRGKEVVIVGRSNIVGKPLALMFVQKRTAANPAGGDATVTIAHTRTSIWPRCAGGRRSWWPRLACHEPSPRTWSRRAPSSSMSASIRWMANLSVTFTKTSPRWRRGCPRVPGGVGPMTIAMLLVNTLEAADSGK